MIVFFLLVKLPRPFLELRIQVEPKDNDFGASLGVYGLPLVGQARELSV